MNRMVVWTFAAVLIGTIGMAGFTVKAQTKTYARLDGHSSDWKCHPSHTRGQKACFNLVDGRHVILAAGMK